MKSANVNPNPNLSAKADRRKTKLKRQPGAWLDVPIGLLVSLILMPVWAVNIAISLLFGRTLFTNKKRLDALGNSVSIRSFTSGFLRRSATFIDVCLGYIGLVGASLNHTLDYQTREQVTLQFMLKPGLTSLQDVHLSVGLGKAQSQQLINQQLAGSTLSYVGILVKAALNWLWFTSKDMVAPKEVNLFGVRLKNVDMKRAVDWVLNGTPFNHAAARSVGRPQVGYYINAHSVNTLSTDLKFKACLNRADALFADGSGMRLAARSKGINLVANLNGTDMLPRICQSASRNGHSLYFLGGKAGIAKKASEKLQTKYQSLEVVGTHDGYFDFDDEATSLKVIEQINRSGADVVMVGFGSPYQELWCEKYANVLECKTVLAVGGLFDYYSGAIPRAPMFMREIGLEWIWRLAQEPKTKFSRYVVGTPEFLIRTFLLKQV